MSPYISQVACLMEQYNGDAAGGAALRALLDDFQAIYRARARARASYG